MGQKIFRILPDDAMRSVHFRFRTSMERVARATFFPPTKRFLSKNRGRRVAEAPGSEKGNGHCNLIYVYICISYATKGNFIEKYNNLYSFLQIRIKICFITEYIFLIAFIETKQIIIHIR